MNFDARNVALNIFLKSFLFFVENLLLCKIFFSQFQYSVEFIFRNRDRLYWKTCFLCYCKKHTHCFEQKNSLFFTLKVQFYMFQKPNTIITL